MCLLLTRQAGGAPLHDEWLKDFRKRNNDGFGFMLAVDGRMHVEKSMGSDTDFIAMWRKYEASGHPFAAHLRMRTHGDRDLSNCHPYMVLDEASGNEMWMMHNGVLSYGNSSNVKMSDTWHFIKDFLSPLLDPAEGGDPTLIYTPQFKSILGGCIGSSNKFVFLDNQGRVSTINRSSGIEWNGMWLSNTYAWSSSDAKTADSMPTPSKGYYCTPGKGGRYDMYNDEGWQPGSPAGEWLNGEFVRYNSQQYTEHKKAGVGASTEKKLVTNVQLAVIEGGKGKKGGKRRGSIRTPSTEQATGGDDGLISPVDLFQALKSAGLEYAWQKLHINWVRRFLLHFDAQDVLNLIELTLSQLITEEQLVQCFNNYVLATGILDEAYPEGEESDTVTSTIEKEVEEALTEAESAVEKLNKECEKIADEAFEGVVAKAKQEAEAAIQKAGSVDQEAQDTAGAAPAPQQAETPETKEQQTMGNHLSEVARSIEAEQVSDEVVATEVHLEESEAAAQLVGSPHTGAE